jgi:MFS family permease
MGAVFASHLGLNVAQVSWLMTGLALGAVVVQWPRGRLSDAMDRRKVIIATSALSTALVVAAIAAMRRPVAELVTVIAIYGGVSVPLYSLFIAHTNDHLTAAHRVAASAGMVLTGGVGAASGPLLCSAMMSAMGPVGFLVFLGATHAAVTGFGVWRMLRREPVPLDDQERYGALAPRTGWISAAIASRTLRAPDPEPAPEDES